MPHVVVTGAPGMPEVFAELEKVMVKEPPVILKTGAAYLEKDGNSVLLEGTAIEGGPPQNFFILLGRRDDGLVVRLHPTTDPEKTDGVKRLLATVGMQVMEKFPGTAVGKTNLQEFLD